MIWSSAFMFSILTTPFISVGNSRRLAQPYHQCPTVQNPYAHESQRNNLCKQLILLIIFVGGTSFELVTPALWTVIRHFTSRQTVTIELKTTNQSNLSIYTNECQHAHNRKKSSCD